MTAFETKEPAHRVLLIKVPRSSPADNDPTALLDATRKWWVVAESRRGTGDASPTHVLPVVGGRVRAAYRIDRWIPAPDGRRWGFEGEPDPQLEALYNGLDVTAYYPPGAANPLRYVNCDESRSPAELITERHTDLRAVVSALEAEALTHLMLGHRELFHSNLLAWFFRRLPAEADAVFGALTTPATPVTSARCGGSTGSWTCGSGGRIATRW